MKLNDTDYNLHPTLPIKTSGRLEFTHTSPTRKRVRQSRNVSTQALTRLRVGLVLVNSNLPLA